MKPTRTSRTLGAILALLAFLTVMGIAGAIEGQSVHRVPTHQGGTP